MVFVWFLYCVVKVYSEIIEECTTSIFRITKSGSAGSTSNWYVEPYQLSKMEENMWLIWSPGGTSEQPVNIQHEHPKKDHHLKNKYHENL
jgi:hypothetical protein